MKWYLVILVLLIFISCSWTRIDELPFGETRTATIYQGERSVAAPHITRLNSGELAMVFHVPSDSTEILDAICLALSTNDGKTWSKPDTVVRVAAKCQRPHMTQFPDGLIVVSFCQYRKTVEAGLSQAIGCFYVKSYDNAKSFTAPAMISIPEYERIVYADAIFSTSDGSWILPALAVGSNQQVDAVAAFSFDGGIHWDEVSVIVQDTSSVFQDMALTQTAINNWLCMLTSEDGKLFQTFSMDNGENWSPVDWSGLYGQGPDLGVTGEGTVLCAFEDNTPLGISCVRSYDFGSTWEGETLLYGKNQNAKDPAIFVLNQRIMTVYCVDKDRDWQFDKIDLTCFDQRKPEAPRGFNGSTADKNVNLRWNPVQGAHYYLVYRSEAFRDSSQNGAIEIDHLLTTTKELAYQDIGLDPGYMYQYQVSAALGKGRLVPNSGNEGQKTKPLIVTVQ